MTEPKKPGWLDTRISVQNALTGLGALILSAVLTVGTWARDLERQVSAAVETNREQDRHFDRLEAAQAQQRTDMNQQLRDISGDVKEIRNYLMNNSVGSRADVQRWSTP